MARCGQLPLEPRPPASYSPSQASNHVAAHGRRPNEKGTHVKVIFVAGIKTLDVGMSRQMEKECELPFAPPLGMDVSSKMWKDRSVKDVLLDISDAGGSAVLYVWMGRDEVDDDGRLKEMVKMYEDEGWSGESEGTPTFIS